MREEIKRRILRILINTGLIFLVVFALGFFNISLSSILTIAPLGGLTLATAVALVIVIILFFMVLRVVLDLIRVIDAASGSLLRYIPGFNPERGPSIIRALKEMLVIFIAAIFVSIASPLISSIPEIGGWLSLAVSVATFIFSIILMYDAGRTLYAAFESSIQVLIDRIVAHASTDKDREVGANTPKKMEN